MILCKRNLKYTTPGQKAGLFSSHCLFYIACIAADILKAKTGIPLLPGHTGLLRSLLLFFRFLFFSKQIF